MTPAIDLDRVSAILREHFAAPAEDLEVLSGGQMSAVYGFRVDSGAFVIRLGPPWALAGFEKERFVAQVIAPLGVPIPRLLRVGCANDHCYAISERASGQRTNALSPAEFLRTIPSLLDTLDAIHAADVRSGRGFSQFDGSGVGEYSSWRASLLRIRDEQEPGTFFGRWHHLFDDSFLERDRFDDLYARMARLLDYCPEERYLVHGDYGLGNVLAENGKVTAVLDWANAEWGDFVRDLAWLDFEMPDYDFRATFRRRFAAQNRRVPHFDERMLCYGCFFAMGNMLFNAYVGNEREYRRAVKRIEGILTARSG